MARLNGMDASSPFKKSSSRGNLRRAMDLDELHPHMMYGALMAFLASIYRSSLDVVPSVVSARVVAVTLLIPVLCALLPLVIVLRFLELTGMLFVLTEVCFFLWLCRRRSRLNVVKPLSQRLLPAQPNDVFQRTLARVDQCATWSVGRTPTEWLEGWFMKTPVANIKRGNAEEFFAWAFFNKYPSELKDDERSQMGNMLEECERRYSWNLAEGYADGVRSMRINFDPVQAWTHPCWYYAAILGLRLATRSTMQLMGFTYHGGAPSGGLSYFHCPPPSRPGLLLEGGKPVEPTRALPVVLIHGLGIGVAPYVQFIRQLSVLRECFVIELPEISQACCETVLPPEVMAEALSAMLQAHGHSQATFVAHSYGTFVMSWVLQFRRSFVAKAVLLDPVALLLAQPDVAYNFLYRNPDQGMLMIAAHFVRWEMFAAHVLMRHFYWHHNVLWKEDLPPNSLVVLSSLDDICNSHYVRRYLEDHQREQAGQKSKLQVLWLEGQFHGGILLSPAALAQVLELI
mmetsp:Transcript_4932/g.11505  ORF Transcript_4932/g.11505 Transcript_4932/m.11505 type:complete len:514 (+) Transcript_4932:86-1627(+)